MPCSYCDLPGHGIDECPDRLEEYHGTPTENETVDIVSDPMETLEEEEEEN